MLEKLQLTFSTVSTRDYRKSNFMFCQIFRINSDLNSFIVHIARRKQKLIYADHTMFAIYMKRNLENKVATLAWIFTKNGGYLNNRCDIKRFSVKNCIVVDYIRKKCRGQYNFLFCIFTLKNDRFVCSMLYNIK